MKNSKWNQTEENYPQQEKIATQVKVLGKHVEKTLKTTTSYCVNEERSIVQ